MGGVPELRFPEFSGEWKEVVVSKVLEFGRSYSFSRAKLSDDGDVNYIHYGDIHKHFQHTINFSRSKLPTVYSSELPPEPFYLQENDLIMADASEDYADIGKSAEVKHIGNTKAVAGLHTFVLRDKGNSFAPSYKGYMFYSPTVTKKLKRIATGISVLGISKGNLSKLPLTIPSLPEQQKIADFLTAIDEKIIILTDKITQLKTYKKGMMQKLLSGELRFPGFTDTWREVKLGETGTIITGSTPPTKDSENYGDDYLWVTPTDIRETKIVYSTNKKLSMVGAEKARMIPKNSLLVTCIASIGKNVILKEKGSCNQQINAITPNGNFDVDFLYYIIENNVNKLLAYAGGGSMLILNKKDFSSIKFEFPPFPEQQKIADFLTAIDDKLTIEQEKLDQLKLYKQGLLQKMFI